MLPVTDDLRKGKRNGGGVDGGGGREDSGAAALRPFTPFLTSMLDHLHHMTPSQVRRLFLLLFAVGDEEDDGGAGPSSMGNSVTDIVIRKHLALASFEKKRIVSPAGTSQVLPKMHLGSPCFFSPTASLRRV